MARSDAVRTGAHSFVLLRFGVDHGFADGLQGVHPGRVNIRSSQALHEVHADQIDGAPRANNGRSSNDLLPPHPRVRSCLGHVICSVAPQRCCNLTTVRKPCRAMSEAKDDSSYAVAEQEHATTCADTSGHGHYQSSRLREVWWMQAEVQTTSQAGIHRPFKVIRLLPPGPNPQTSWRQDRGRWDDSDLRVNSETPSND